MRTDHIRASLAVMLCSVLFVRCSAAAPSAVTIPTGQMDVWWDDLKGSDPAASRALLNFSSHPDEAVSFLKRKLRPLTVDPDVIEALLTQLGSSKESEWKQAFDDLQYFDPRLAIDLPTLMDQVKDSPTRQRLVEVLSNMAPGSLTGATITFGKVGSNNGWYNFFVQKGKERYSMGAQANISKLNSSAWEQNPQWTRATRAIALLEHIDTPAAVVIIKDMATGNPDAQPTKVARESLARLAKP